MPLQALGFKASGKTELVRTKKPTICDGQYFGEYDLRALGIPLEAFPPHFKVCHGKHGYTVVNELNNAVLRRERQSEKR